MTLEQKEECSNHRAGDVLSGHDWGNFRLQLLVLLEQSGVFLWGWLLMRRCHMVYFLQTKKDDLMFSKNEQQRNQSWFCITLSRLSHTLFHQTGACSRSVPDLAPTLCVSTDKEPVPGVKNWHLTITIFLLGQSKAPALPALIVCYMMS